MLANILKLGALSGLVGGYFYVSRQNRISLTNPYLGKAFQLIHQHKPQYTQLLFKTLLKLKILEKDEKLQSFILGGGFDPEGDYIEEVAGLGFAGLEVGPTTFNASLQEDSEQSMGIMHALANICTYKGRKGREGFCIYLSIAPNFQILKYTPYLLRENLIGAFENYLKIQQRYDDLLVESVDIVFQRSGYSMEGLAIDQVQKMINKIKLEAIQKAKKFNESRKTKIAVEFTRPQSLEWGRLLDYIINRQSL